MPGPLDLLVVQVGELGAPRVVGGGVHVGEVVRDHLDPHVLRRHAGRRDVQCTHVALLVVPAQPCWPEDAHHEADALVLLVEQLLAVLVGALHLDHAGHLGDRADVRLLEEALDDAAVLDRGSGAVVGAEEDARLAEEPGPGPRRSTRPTRATGAPSTETVPSAATATAFASNGMVISPPPSSSSGWPSMLTTVPLGVAGEGAGAGQPLAGRGHDGEVALALDREVERAAGLLQRSLQLVGVAGAGRGHRDAAAFERQRAHLLGEDQALAAVAGGGEVRDVVRDRLELLGEARLARQGNVAGKVHRTLPRSRETRAPSGTLKCGDHAPALVKISVKAGRRRPQPQVRPGKSPQNRPPRRGDGRS